MMWAINDAGSIPSRTDLGKKLRLVLVVVFWVFPHKVLYSLIIVQGIPLFKVIVGQSSIFPVCLKCRCEDNNNGTFQIIYEIAVESAHWTVTFTYIAKCGALAVPSRMLICSGEN